MIDECLIPHGIQTHECEKEHWKFNSEEDFKYGHKAGVVIGITLGYYIAKYGKIPANEDLTEMTKMVELRKDEIKKVLQTYTFSIKYRIITIFKFNNRTTKK